MSEKISVLIADDIDIDRRVLKETFRRLAPEFDVSEHSQGATLLSRLLRAPPRLLILDRAFTDNQKKKSRYSREMFTLAQDIRKKFPKLNKMAILMYSRWTTDEEAAEVSRRFKAEGIWSRSKDVNHKLLVGHINDILSQWPGRKVKDPGHTGPKKAS